MGKTELNPKSLDGRGLRVAVVAARYNPKVADGLLQGSLLALQGIGIPEQEIEIYRVPGAFELPLLAKQIAKTGKFDAVVCLGVVIRGDTSHFDYVCEGVTQGLMRATLETEIPMAFGVLTTDNEAQALARSSDDEHNKGREASLTAVEMALLKKKVQNG